MKGFKVVRNSNERLISIVSYPPLTYPPGEWVHPRPKCGPIAVFDVDFFAVQFVEILNRRIAPLEFSIPIKISFEIWECEWKQWTDGPLTFQGTDYPLWTNISREEPNRTNAPSIGTQFASAVKLTCKTGKGISIYFNMEEE